jgi:site-specific DNA-methyltransferase (adenine-specific)/adenine-specific DNA-methyltransferase
MDKKFLERVIDALRHGENLPADWARFLFPPEKREAELVYDGKEREEEILADTMSVPLQPVSTFGLTGTGWHNKLIFGDNLQAMKTLLQMKEAGELRNADGTSGVRLVYIDPPFATKKEFRGSHDEQAYQDRITGAAFLEFLRHRLVMLRELLSEDGSIYVHLDGKKAHYVKVLMDELFGEQNFMNEIAWCYATGGASRDRFSRKHDTILFYAKNAQQKLFNLQKEREYYDKPFFNEQKDEQGRYYADVIMKDYWKIPAVINVSKERTGYPTQKPELLLERIIQASSNEGDLVLDAFAGSGTTCIAAEKLRRRWIAVDCGKLSIYTIQKRLLHLSGAIDGKRRQVRPASFTLYNAGLYDFASLRKLPWQDWRFFALQLFGCKDETHQIAGLQLDGKLKGSSVLVFNHDELAGKRIDEETVRDLHVAIGNQIGKRFFMIAPRGSFDFQQDYLDFDGVRYYALRIPYSIINELHTRSFTALEQPRDEGAINATVDAVGFDFIRPPRVAWLASARKAAGGTGREAVLRIRSFASTTRAHGVDVAGGLETFAMLMLDLDYDGEVFDLDKFYLANDLQRASWEVPIPVDSIGKQVMAVFIDIYGNESREIIPRNKFGLLSGGPARAVRNRRQHAA